MSGDHIVEELQAMYVAQETSFGVGGTTIRMFPEHGSVEHTPSVDEIPYQPLRTRPWDYAAPVKGNRHGAVKLKGYLQPDTDYLDSAGVVDSTTNAQAKVLEALCGGMSVFAGTLLTGTPTTTSGSVTAAQGSRCPAGQIVLIEDPTEGLVFNQIITRATDATTWRLALANAPSAAAKVVNTRTYYPTRTNTKSLVAELGNAQDADYQWRYRGLTGSFDVMFEQNKLAMFSVELKGFLSAGPSALSLSTAHAEDNLAPPYPCTSTSTLLQLVSATTRAVYPVDSAQFKFNLGNTHEMGLSGSTYGMRQVIRSETLNEPGCVATITMPADQGGLDADWYTDRDPLHFVLWQSYTDSNGDLRMCGVQLPRAVIVGKPTTQKGDQQLLKNTITLHSMLDQSCSGSLDNDELAKTPWRLFTT